MSSGLLSPGIPTRTQPQSLSREAYPVLFLWPVIAALIGAGVVSLLMTFVIAASTPVAAGPESPGLAAALDYLVRHAGQGLILRFCQSGWEPGYPAHFPASCTDITDPSNFEREHPALRYDEFIWIEFQQRTLNLAELIRLWGRPMLERRRGIPLGLRWNLGGYALSGWLTWGDPHTTPETAILELDSVGGRGGPPDIYPSSRPEPADSRKHLLVKFTGESAIPQPGMKR